MIRDVATVRQGVRPGEIDRDMSQRYLTLTANVEGEDMGRASRQVAKAIAAAGEPPRGVRVEPMGQLPPMIEMFKALGIGLAVAVFVIFVLLTAYFQSPRLALISVGAVPGVLAGIATILYFTNTSLNIESFMGSIMCLGVSVSNSVMLVTFMDEHWKGGAPRPRRPSSARRAAAADLDDGLRDDRRHGADGAGAGAREPDAGPARPGGHRRAGDVDVRHLAGAPLDLRGRDRPERCPLAVDLPGRPRKPALRPAGSSPEEDEPGEVRRPTPGEASLDSGLEPVDADEMPATPRIPDTASRELDGTAYAQSNGTAPTCLEISDAPRPLRLAVSDRCCPAAAGSCSGSWPPLALHRAAAPSPRSPSHERLQAPDRAGHPAGGPQDRPRRRAAELHRKLTSARRSIPS